MEKNTILILAIFGIIFLSLGFGIGLTMKKVPACNSNCPKTSACLLDSKLTGSWSGFAKGEVKEISGRDLTLTSEGETLIVSILEAARIQFLEEDKIKEAKFEDIMVGKKVQIQSLLIEKKLLGNVVTILP